MASKPTQLDEKLVETCGGQYDNVVICCFTPPLHKCGPPYRMDDNIYISGLNAKCVSPQVLVGLFSEDQYLSSDTTHEQINFNI